MVGQVTSSKNLMDLLHNSIRTPAPLIALVATLVLGVLLWCGGMPLKDPVVAPTGGAALQFAWSTERAQAIVDHWRLAQVHPAPQILWDFLFIIAYSYFLFAFGTVAAGYAKDRKQCRLKRVAEYAALAGLFAGVFDVFENFGLLMMIQLGTYGPVPFLTSLAASIKYLLIAIAFLVPLGSLIWPDHWRFSD